MASLAHALNYHQLPAHDLQLDQYAQQILDNAKTIAPTASTPTITTFDAKSSSDFLQKLGASLINTIQLQNLHRTDRNLAQPIMDIPDFAPNHAVIDSSSYDSMDELQKQLEYDKFMNEIWIGIVLTLILISMVFCICSCFLYHQFRTWKRNYHNTVAQALTQDIEAVKLQADLEDPVPEYTLVSGLPSYEAALELLQKKPQSTCVIVYPSVFGVFNKNEKPTQQQQQQVVEVTTPLLANTAMTPSVPAPTYAESQAHNAPSYITLTHVNEKAMEAAKTATTTTTTATNTVASSTAYVRAPSYEEALLEKAPK